MTPTKPDKERVYLVQVLASIEVRAASKTAARQIALLDLARQLEHGAQIVVHVEEVKPV
jgi:hypothetical protein